MPYKDPIKRAEAVRKSIAKKPEHYRMLGRMNQRTARHFNYILGYRYGINKQIYDEMLANKNGVCKICGNPPDKKSRKSQRLHVDHDHKANKVRGLLCRKCNMGLGVVEQREFVAKAEAYLEENS